MRLMRDDLAVLRGQALVDFYLETFGSLPRGSDSHRLVAEMVTDLVMWLHGEK